jgi:phosphoenolpyruvate carboxylase
MGLDESTTRRVSQNVKLLERLFHEAVSYLDGEAKLAKVRQARTDGEDLSALNAEDAVYLVRALRVYQP